MKNICSLSYEPAVEAIKNTEYVMFKHGVWNPYSLTSTASAIKSINNSGYGADVQYDEEKDMYYVSIPSSGDMW